MTEKTSAQSFYKEERAPDPLIGCVDLNAVHEAEKAKEAEAASDEAAPAKRGR